MKFPWDVEKTRVSVEEGQRPPVRNDSHLEKDDPLTETVKRLKERVELVEAVVKKLSATEGETCRAKERFTLDVKVDDVMRLKIMKSFKKLVIIDLIPILSNSIVFNIAASSQC